MKRILVDTCFWFGLTNQKDQHHSAANNIAPTLEKHIIVVPWPCLYETLNTKFAKHGAGKATFLQWIQRDNMSIVCDADYRESALEEFWKSDRSLSLVDCVIREMLKDANIDVNILVTFNIGDFVDLTTKRNIEIIEDV